MTRAKGRDLPPLLAPVTVDIPCNATTHRVTFANGRVRFLDHPFQALAFELALEVPSLSGCATVLAAIRVPDRRVAPPAAPGGSPTALDRALPTGRPRRTEPATSLCQPGRLPPPDLPALREADCPAAGERLRRARTRGSARRPGKPPGASLRPDRIDLGRPRLRGFQPPCLFRPSPELDRDRPGHTGACNVAHEHGWSSRLVLRPRICLPAVSAGFL